jgi:hypothetical protein
VTISAPHPHARSAAAAACATTLLVCALTAAGFGLTVLALYPGYMTNDATYVYGYIEHWELGDWQSPLLTMIWWLIDPIAPGPGSMFLLIVTLYWLGFAVVALAVARRSAALALAVPLLALAPPAFILLSMIWRDILFSSVWLFAAAILYAAADRTGPLRNRWALRDTSPCKGEVRSRSDPGGGPATSSESAGRRDPHLAPSAPSSPLQGEEIGTAVPKVQMRSPWW